MSTVRNTALLFCVVALSFSVALEGNIKPFDSAVGKKIEVLMK